MPRWTLESRAKQAEKIRSWQPWKASTGPKTHAGKARSSQNALKTGEYSASTLTLMANLHAYVASLGEKKLRRVHSK